MAQPNANTGSLDLNFEAGVLEGVGQSVIVTNLDWTIIQWNRFAETLYGWSSIEAPGRNLGELIVPETPLTNTAEICVHREAPRARSEVLAALTALMTRPQQASVPIWCSVLRKPAMAVCSFSASPVSTP